MQRRQNFYVWPSSEHLCIRIQDIRFRGKGWTAKTPLRVNPHETLETLVNNILTTVGSEDKTDSRNLVQFGNFVQIFGQVNKEIVYF